MLKSLKKIKLVSKTSAILKGFLQENKAAKGLRYYHELAKEKGIDCVKKDAVKETLSNRLANRKSFLSKKSKGQLHIFLAYYISNWEAVLQPSLEPFGKVTEFNWREKGYIDSSADWLDRRDKMNCDMLEAFHRANEAQPVDVVVGYMSGYTVAPQILQKMTEAGTVVVNFCWDDKLSFPGDKIGGRFRSPAAIASHVDLNLTNAPESIIKYAVHGGLAMFWPEAAYPKVHRPYNIPFEYDVSFAGSCYGWRPDFIKKLGQYGIKVECFGHGWPNGPLSNEEIVKLYSKSRINLGFGGVGYSKKLMCLKGRDFETPASGGLYLTQDNPELSLVYDVGKEILTYTDAQNCSKIIKRLLDNPQEAENIRQAGRERCLRDHTYMCRWSEVFRTIGVLHEDKN